MSLLTFAARLPPSFRTPPAVPRRLFHPRSASRRMSCGRLLAVGAWLLCALGVARASLPLADALDTVFLSWQTSPEAPWISQAAITWDGVDAAQSGPIIDSQET